MRLFASDLDKTLIHSYKAAAEDDICVEMKEEKKLSFMTENALESLHRICLCPDVMFTPVTTRSVEQYNRIHFFENFTPHLACAANGGILLVDGISDSKWFIQSQSLINDAHSAMKKGIHLLENDPDVYFEVRLVDEMFVFTKSHNTSATKKILCDMLDLSKVSIYNIGEKVYIFPAVLTKGLAVKRLAARFGFKQIICAGDSEFDIPMLEQADIAYYPDELTGYVNNTNSCSFDDTGIRFADRFLKDLEKRCFNEVN